MASFLERLSAFVSESGSQATNDTGETSESSLSPSTLEEDAIFNRAAAMTRKVDFTYSECVIMIAADEGFDDGEIGTMIGRSAGTVKRKKEKLRDERHEIEQQVAHELDALSGLERFD